MSKFTDASGVAAQVHERAVLSANGRPFDDRTNGPAIAKAIEALFDAERKGGSDHEIKVAQLAFARAAAPRAERPVPPAHVRFELALAARSLAPSSSPLLVRPVGAMQRGARRRSRAPGDDGDSDPEGCVASKGPERLRAFRRLPASQRAAFWRSLRTEVETREATARAEVVAP